jgi:phosphatidylglycerol:prolipoprotein diacylglycerol transferase
MLTYPEIDPIAVQIGPLAIHWYGVTYLVAFLGVYWMLRYRATRHAGLSPVTVQQLNDWLFYAALGVILGGRLGYCLFYQPALFVDFEPLGVFDGWGVPFWGVLRIWEGGMSFHGGLLGVMLASWLFGRQLGRTFFQMMDFLAPAAPFGLLCGRVGNFINGELWGRPTDLPWGMVFPHVDRLPRHPSMVYEALLEGVVLLAVMWWYSARPRPRAPPPGHARRTLRTLVP